MFESFTITLKVMDTKFDTHKIDYHVFDRKTAIAWGKQAHECIDVISVDVVSSLTGEVVYWTDSCGEHGDN